MPAGPFIPLRCEICLTASVMKEKTQLVYISVFIISALGGETCSFQGDVNISNFMSRKVVSVVWDISGPVGAFVGFSAVPYLTFLRNFETFLGP